MADDGSGSFGRTKTGRLMLQSFMEMSEVKSNPQVEPGQMQSSSSASVLHDHAAVDRRPAEEDEETFQSCCGGAGPDDYNEDDQLPDLAKAPRYASCIYVLNLPRGRTWREYDTDDVRPSELQRENRLQREVRGLFQDVLEPEDIEIDGDVQIGNEGSHLQGLAACVTFKSTKQEPQQKKMKLNLQEKVLDNKKYKLKKKIGRKTIYLTTDGEELGWPVKDTSIQEHPCQAAAIVAFATGIVVMYVVLGHIQGLQCAVSSRWSSCPVNSTATFVIYAILVASIANLVWAATTKQTLKMAGFLLLLMLLLETAATVLAPAPEVYAGSKVDFGACVYMDDDSRLHVPGMPSTNPGVQQLGTLVSDLCGYKRMYFTIPKVYMEQLRVVTTDVADPAPCASGSWNLFTKLAQATPVSLLDERTMSLISFAITNDGIDIWDDQFSGQDPDDARLVAQSSDSLVRAFCDILLPRCTTQCEPSFHLSEARCTELRIAFESKEGTRGSFGVWLPGGKLHQNFQDLVSNLGWNAPAVAFLLGTFENCLREGNATLSSPATCVTDSNTVTAGPVFLNVTDWSYNAQYHVKSFEGYGFDVAAFNASAGGMSGNCDPDRRSSLPLDARPVEVVDEGGLIGTIEGLGFIALVIVMMVVLLVGPKVTAAGSRHRRWRHAVEAKRLLTRSMWFRTVRLEGLLLVIIGGFALGLAQWIARRQRAWYFAAVFQLVTIIGLLTVGEWLFWFHFRVFEHRSTGFISRVKAVVKKLFCVERIAFLEDTTVYNVGSVLNELGGEIINIVTLEGNTDWRIFVVLVGLVSVHTVAGSLISLLLSSSKMDTNLRILDSVYTLLYTLLTLQVRPIHDMDVSTCYVYLIPILSIMSRARYATSAPLQIAMSKAMWKARGNKLSQGHEINNEKSQHDQQVDVDVQVVKPKPKPNDGATKAFTGHRKGSKGKKKKEEEKEQEEDTKEEEQGQAGEVDKEEEESITLKKAGSGWNALRTSVSAIGRMKTMVAQTARSENMWYVDRNDTERFFFAEHQAKRVQFKRLTNDRPSDEWVTIRGHTASHSEEQTGEGRELVFQILIVRDPPVTSDEMDGWSVGVAFDNSNAEGLNHYGYVSSGEKHQPGGAPDPFGMEYEEGDVIMVHVDFAEKTIGFSKNGQFQGIAYNNIPNMSPRHASPVVSCRPGRLADSPTRARSLSDVLTKRKDKNANANANAEEQEEGHGTLATFLYREPRQAWKPRTPVAKAVFWLVALVGLVLLVATVSRVATQYFECQDGIGQVIWKHTSPQALFPNGFLKPSDCGNEYVLEMTLHDTGITSLLPVVQHFRNLEKLDVSRCGITHVPDALADITTLRHLDLSSNVITFISPRVFSMVGLEQLHVNDNPFASTVIWNDANVHSLPHLFVQKLQDTLQLLSVRNNPIGIVPLVEIAQFPLLREVDLSGCQLIRWPTVALQSDVVPQNLRMLNLSHNSLAEVPIRIAPASWPGAQSITLDLSYNSLRFAQSNVVSFPGTLHLQGNSGLVVRINSRFDSLPMSYLNPEVFAAGVLQNGIFSPPVGGITTLPETFFHYQRDTLLQLCVQSNPFQYSWQQLLTRLQGFSRLQRLPIPLGPINASVWPTELLLNMTFTVFVVTHPWALFSSDTHTVGPFPNSTRLIRLTAPHMEQLHLPPHLEFFEWTGLKRVPHLDLRQSCASLRELSVYSTDADGTTAVPSSDMHHTQSLSSLKLSGCNKLYHAFLGHNNLTDSTVEGLQDLTALVSLSLGCNHFTSSPLSSTTSYPLLRHLDLSHNSVTVLLDQDQDRLQTPALYTLWLHNNPLTSVQANAFDHIQQLNWLSLLSPTLSSLPHNVFVNVSSLRILELGAGTAASSASSAWSCHPSHGGVNVSQPSPLTQLPTSLGVLTGLKVLTLERTHLLTTIPSQLANINQLECLSLYGSGLSLSALPTVWQQRAAAGTLQVSYNEGACRDTINLYRNETLATEGLADAVTRQLYCNGCNASQLLPSAFQDSVLAGSCVPPLGVRY